MQRKSKEDSTNTLILSVTDGETVVVQATILVKNFRLRLH